MLSCCHKILILTSRPSCLLFDPTPSSEQPSHTLPEPCPKMLPSEPPTGTESHEGVAGASRYHCPQRAAGSGQSLLTMACGLVEPCQFNTSELCKHYPGSVCCVGERVGSAGTSAGTKGPSQWPSICLCQSQPPHCHSSAPVSAVPWDSCAPRGEHQGVGVEA